MSKPLRMNKSQETDQVPTTQRFNFGRKVLVKPLPDEAVRPLPTDVEELRKQIVGDKEKKHGDE
ncbi:MAG: hypothetical protein AB7F86_09725 [Bdellovibrionales bacterium]